MANVIDDLLEKMAHAVKPPLATNVVRTCDIVEATKEEPAIVVARYPEDAAALVAAYNAVPALVAVAKAAKRLHSIAQWMLSHPDDKAGWAEFDRVTYFTGEAIIKFEDGK